MAEHEEKSLNNLNILITQQATHIDHSTSYIYRSLNKPHILITQQLTHIDWTFHQVSYRHHIHTYKQLVSADSYFCNVLFQCALLLCSLCVSVYLPLCVPFRVSMCSCSCFCVSVYLPLCLLFVFLCLCSCFCVPVRVSLSLFVFLCVPVRVSVCIML